MSVQTTYRYEATTVLRNGKRENWYGKVPATSPARAAMTATKMVCEDALRDERWKAERVVKVSVTVVEV